MKLTNTPAAAPKDEPIVADYPVIEMAGTSRLILGLGDGRMFGVDLAEPLDGKPGERAQIKAARLGTDGAPQKAELVKFL